MKKTKFTLCSFIFMLILFAGCKSKYNKNMESKDKVIYQYSTVNALMKGLFDGNISCEQLHQYGSFGIGTFNGIDGEMVMLDDKIYKASHTGKLSQVQETDCTPFSIVCNFSPDTTISLKGKMNLADLEYEITKLLPKKNWIYAIKATGNFDSLKTRAIPKQNKPYTTLVEASKKQNTFQLTNVTGSLVGFYFPDYMQDINVTGYHFHFLSTDKNAGGHVLSCDLTDVQLQIEGYKTFELILPTDAEFGNMNLHTNKADIDTVERNKK